MNVFGSSSATTIEPVLKLYYFPSEISLVAKIDKKFEKIASTFKKLSPIN